MLEPSNVSGYRPAVSYYGCLFIVYVRHAYIMQHIHRPWYFSPVVHHQEDNESLRVGHFMAFTSVDRPTEGRIWERIQRKGEAEVTEDCLTANVLFA